MKKLKMAIIVGTRPEIIKASIFIRELKQQDWVEFQIWHTGQHYDFNMSEIFYKELGISPNVDFGIGSGSHAIQLSKLLIAVEERLIEYVPDLIVLIGDTNSTMGVAFMARRLNIPIAHIEAGCREFNVKYENEVPVFSRDFGVMQYPEEVNRIVTDRCSTLLFTATEFDLTNLHREDILGEYSFTGDITYDSFLAEREKSKEKNTLENLNLKEGYNLVTLHRAENTDDQIHIKNIIEAFIESETYIVFPMHPRTRKVLESNGLLGLLLKSEYIRVIDPVGYHDMINLMTHAKRIFTDSGGVQREAYFLKVPCVTLRSVSAWIELINGGADKIIGTDKEAIMKELKSNTPFPTIKEGIYGFGHATENIVQSIFEWATKLELVGKSYKRRKPVRALLAIISARDIPEVKEKINSITCVDKVWFKYMSLKDNLKRVEDYFLSHPQYTHLILNSDDGAPSNEQIAMLIADVKEYDFPIISGCCCVDKLTNNMNLNVSIDEVSNVGTTLCWYFLNYRLLPYRFANQNMLMKVWFQGAAACCMRRDVVERVRLVYPEYDDNPRPWFKIGDLAFAYKCSQLKISQYVDLRCYFDHHKYDISEGVGKVYNQGEKPAEIVFEKASSRVPKKEPAPISERKEGFDFDSEKKHRIFIGVPICNEDVSIERCIDSILKLNYPKELIDVLFIENNSSDNSWKLILQFVEIAKEKHNYHSFEAVQDWGNYGKVPKGKDEWGHITMDRAKHLCHVQNRIMDEANDHHCDFCLTIMADCMVLPDTIKYYLKVFEHRYDAGWAGGVLHKRYPHHEWDERLNPIYYGLASPTLKYYDDDPIPKDFKREWIFTLEKMQKGYKNYPYSYGFRGMKENEIVGILKTNPLPILEVCCTGHAWMIRKELFDLRFDVTVVETGLQFETDMGNRGYKMYCHLGVYIVHISADGKIWHTGLVDEEEKVKIGIIDEGTSRKIEKSIYYSFIKEIAPKYYVDATIEQKADIERRLESFALFLREYVINESISIPKCPQIGERTFDNIFRRIINDKDWNKLYGPWSEFITDRDFYNRFCAFVKSRKV